MILNLNNNLFITNPLSIYREHGISNKEWNNIWYKRKFLEYQIKELVEYIQVVLHKDITCKQLSRFLMRYELYLLIQPLVKQNELTIHISFFPDNIKSFIKDYYNE